LLLFVIVNSLGVKVFARTNTGLTWIKLGVPCLVGTAIVVTSVRFENFTEFGGFLPYGIEGVFAGVSTGGVIFALIGFRHAIDMAGEVKRPRVTIPIALTFSVVICVAVYMLLQFAFIGSIPPEQLARGWSHLTFPGHLGPIAGVAMAVGLGWANVVLYAGAVVAPLGGGLVATGSNARLGYALGQNGFFPSWFQGLSKRAVPLRSLGFNFLFGTSVFLWVPFKEAVALNGAAITLSFAAGPISLIALRYQLASAERLFRLPLAGIAAPLAFAISTLIVYWSGWETNLRLFGAIMIGVLLFALRVGAGSIHADKLDLREGLWLAPYILGAGIFSYLGRFGGGIGLIVFPWDGILVSLFALCIYKIAVWCRLPDHKAELYRLRYDTEEPADTTPL
ncbi:MAG: APC family permease, partial [Myxococcota bacterium]